MSALSPTEGGDAPFDVEVSPAALHRWAELVGRRLVVSGQLPVPPAHLLQEQHQGTEPW
jgi:hypothetical protein